jgi:hypothetical protein
MFTSTYVFREACAYRRRFAGKVLKYLFRYDEKEGERGVIKR